LILASAARRSVMSSTSTTVPPASIGWNVHSSARSGVTEVSKVVMLAARQAPISAMMAWALGDDSVFAAMQAAAKDPSRLTRCPEAPLAGARARADATAAATHYSRGAYST